jgi:hypothetical protein
MWRTEAGAAIAVGGRAFSADPAFATVGAPGGAEVGMARFAALLALGAGLMCAGCETHPEGGGGGAAPPPPQGRSVDFAREDVAAP